MKKGKANKVVNPAKKSILVNGRLPQETRERYETSYAASEVEYDPWVEKLQDSRRLSKEDFSVRVNARDLDL